MNKLFLILSMLAVLAFSEQVEAFECTRESVYQEFNEIKSRVEQEKQALQERHNNNKKRLDGLMNGSSAFGRMGQRLRRERLQREAQERANLESRHRREIFDFKEMVTLLCK
jgi:hypothetical protein